MKSIITCLIWAAMPLLAFAQSGLTNDLIWSGGEFSSESVSGLNSMNDGMHYTSLEASDAFGTRIVKYSYATGEEVGTIASSRDIFGDTRKSIDGYEFSSDEKQLLIQTETEGIYRYSFKADYYLFNLDTKKTTPLADFAKGKQLLASFSPDGRKVAFVRDNNLFVFDSGSGNETAITTDGVFNQVINGATDWVYEEEFAIAKGFQWSPLGDRIAFYRFDEREVKEFSMDMFGELYPTQYRFKYPKAGEKNSTIQIWIWDERTGKNTLVDTGRGDVYIPRIAWTTGNDVLCVLRMNRLQNKLEYLFADMREAQPFRISTRVVYTETSATYIDINDALTFLKDGSGFIILSEKDGYNHLYRMDMNGKEVAQLTRGTWEVIDFYGYDEAGQAVYFSANLVNRAAPPKRTKGNAPAAEQTRDEVSAIQKHVYVQSLKKGGTCSRLSINAGTNDAEFSRGFKNFILVHSDANTPAYTSLHTQTGKLIRVLKDNASLKTRLATYGLTKKEFFSFTNNGGTSLNCWMMKPAGFSPSKSYPVLVAIYGGPGSNTVTDAWGGRNFMWHQLLCQEGYVVVSCDPRGTMNRGRDFKHSTYMNLGKQETEDFIDLARYLSGLNYIDKNRIGMQGWSYGGYMTSLCMTKGVDYYKTGIAVAPVTNWKYYDTIYTERFLRTPQENSGGYENNSPINFVNALKGNFLLIHGTADDNVHYQNTMDMTTALVNANKPFDLFVYPNKNHGIYGGKTRLHLYNKMTTYLKEKL